jgi:tyrosyl-tRNA synthetase
MKKLSFEERFRLITRNLQEVISEEELRNLLTIKKEVSVYWGTTPTGSISIAYFFPMMKIADFLKAGLKVKILLADLHAALDSVPWKELEKRYIYYKEAILTMLKTLDVNVSKLEFVKGSKIQLNKKYFYDLLKLSTFSNLKICNKAASEVVKLGDNPKLAGMIYPLMQALDEEYLEVDIQFGGMDQRKIMVYAREYLPKIGYKSRVELINPLIRGLVGEKMSSSIRATKIDLMDDEKTVQKLINKADFVEGNSENGIMALLKHLIFVRKKDTNESFLIARPEKWGGNLEYNDYLTLEKEVLEKKVHPMDIKNALAKEINFLLDNFRKNKKLQELHKLAYLQDA